MVRETAERVGAGGRGRGVKEMMRRKIGSRAKHTSHSLRSLRHCAFTFNYFSNTRRMDGIIPSQIYPLRDSSRTASLSTSQLPHQ